MKRKLYSDNSVHRISKTALVVINGIDSMTDRDDLASRAIQITLPPVEGRRRGGAEIELEFEEARPRLLGALFASMSRALRDLDSVEMSSEPRMLDAIRWVVAAEPALPFERGEVERTLEQSALAATEAAIENNPVAMGVIGLFSGGETHWRGSITALKDELSKSYSEVRTMKARKVAAELNRAKPALEQLGYVVAQLPSKEARTRRTVFEIKQQT